MIGPVDVVARRWRGGWELQIDASNITQCRTLNTAPQQVRDYLDTLDPDTDHSDIEVFITPEISGLSDEIRSARESTIAASEAQAKAAAQTRSVVSALRAEQLTGREIAQILGVTPGRVSQLSRG
ncbi:MAG: antitoxin HicB [Microbacteriaceae bacterium]